MSEAGNDEEKKAAAAKYLTDTLQPAQAAATNASDALSSGTAEKSKIEASITELEEAQNSIALAVSKQTGVVELKGGSTASLVNEKTVETLSNAVVKIVEFTQNNHNTPGFCYDVMKEAVESEEEKRLAYPSTFSEYCTVAMNALAGNRVN